MKYSEINKISSSILEGLKSVATTRDTRIESLVAKAISGTVVTYDAVAITEEEGTAVPKTVSIYLNSDDVLAEVSSNMAYIYIVPSKLDIRLDNQVSTNHQFLPVSPKSWFGDDQLFLMKINTNSNEVYLFSPEEKRFKNITEGTVTYSDTNMSWLSDVLTPEYLSRYLESELKYVLKK